MTAEPAAGNAPETSPAASQQPPDPLASAVSAMEAAEAAELEASAADEAFGGAQPQQQPQSEATDAPANTPEATAPSEEEEAKSDPVLERGWTALERKEQELFNRQLQMKGVEDENRLLKQRLEKFEGTNAQNDELGRRDPVAYMQQRFGFTPSDIANRLLNPSSPQSALPPQPQQAGDKPDSYVQKLEERINELEGMVHINSYRDGVSRLVSGDGYELLRAHPAGATDYVMGVAGRMAKMGLDTRDPRVVADRAQREYAEYLKQLKSHAAVMRELGVQAPAVPANGSEAPTSQALASGTSQQPAAGGTAPPTTLTSDVSAAAGGALTDEEHARLSQRDIISRAAALLQD